MAIVKDNRNGLAMGSLDLPCLVLNKHWCAITTTNVKRAITLMYIDAARAICPVSYQLFDFETWLQQEISDDEVTIEGATRRIKVPEIITLTRYGGTVRQLVSFNRRNLYRRDGKKCSYCGKSCSLSELTMDHIVPASKGGKSTWNNCVVACRDCNQVKADKTPEEAGMKLLRDPKPPKWSPYLYIPADNRPLSWKVFIKE